MLELLHAAISSVNIIYTILLAVVLIYWTSIIIGVLDISAFDIDVDVDVDVDLDVDIDVDADVDVDADSEVGSGAWFAGALHFFNFGKLPFMVIMSFVILFQWAMALLANHHFGHGSIIFSLVTILPILFVSLLTTKVITTPLIPFFAKLNTAEEAVNYIGKIGTLILPPTRKKAGQAEVIENGNPLIISVKANEDEPLPNKGDEIIIISEAENKAYFIITQFI